MVEIDEDDLDEEDRELEKKLAKSFFNLPKETREPLQETIPLKILKRLNSIHKGEDSKSANLMAKGNQICPE